MASRLKAATATIHQAEAEKKATDKIRLEIEDLKCPVSEKEEEIAEVQQAELELRKKARELADERQAFELEVARKIDAEREKHIQRIALNTAGMYGDVRGIIGTSLPEIEVFELKSSGAQAI